MCLYLPQTRLIKSGDTWLGICAVMTTDIEAELQSGERPLSVASSRLQVMLSNDFGLHSSMEGPIVFGKLVVEA